MSGAERNESDPQSERLAALTPEQRQLLALLRRKQAAAKRPRRPSPPPPIPPRGPGDSWPLSFDQERLWFLYALDPEATAYNIDTSTRMRGRLDVPALTRALQAVVRRHEAWRTTFPATDGQPVQVVAPEVRLPIASVDLREVPADRREAVCQEHQRGEARRPFDLARGPLVRVLLARWADDEWICMITVHHIVTDWVTFHLFWRELAVLYTAEITGTAGELPRLDLQYADFAVWQRDWLQGEVLEIYLDFWRQELADAPQVLELPFDRPRPAVQTTRGGQQEVEVPGRRAEALKALARQEGATPFMAVLAAWQAQLFRLTGQEKILLGSPNANRNRVEIEPLFGFFLTQLVFATDGAGNPTFRELLGRVRQAALGAYAHQDLPFGKLLEDLKPERDNRRPPLVQANFLLLDAEYTPLALPDLEVTPIWVDDGNSRFDLTLGLWDSPSRIFGFLEYNRDLFDPTTAARMAEAFRALIEAVVEAPETRLSDLPLLAAPARHQALVEWNDTGEGEREPTFPALFAAQVRNRPADLALVSSGVELTYAELDRRAAGVASRLRAAGVAPGDVVGLALDRSLHLPVAILGVWQAGAVLLPLDPALPGERLAFLIADAEARLILTRETLRPDLPEVDLPILDIDVGSAPLLTSPRTQPASSPGGGIHRPDLSEAQVHAGDIAYLLYTSGTTGQPKGVIVEHGNLAATLAACREELGFTAADRLLSVAPFSFDIFFFELCLPLVSGGSCELFAATAPLDLDALLASLREATRFHAVPALLRQVAAAAGIASVSGPAAFPALRSLYTGGDAVPADLLAALAATFPGAERRVLYGPTEATILATSERIDLPLPSRVGTPLGRPLPGARLRVVDPTGGLAALGAAGELWIGGAAVTRGYLRRDELTGERFVTVDGERWYRSGDRVRRRADGVLEFLGRIDGQVKVRGFRIEPGEIEAALAGHPDVAESVVMARALSGAPGADRQLVAYVVPRRGEAGLAALRAEALAGFLRQRLPGHMVPALFVPLAALPLTAHGKVDRKALLAPASLLAAADGQAAAHNPREAALAEIWQGVLGLARVGIHDNFFQLGGDSILSIQVVARARRAGLVITPKQLFEHQTIAGLAAVARVLTDGASTAQGPVEGEAPLTPIQRHFFAVPRPEPWRFNQSLLFASRLPLAAPFLGRALDLLVDHHDALRLRFAPEQEGWRASHAPAGAGAPLLAVDLAALPIERASGAVETAVEELQGGLDLGRGPLVAAALFQGRPGGDDRLLLTVHHMVVDGVSWRVLLEDLETVYRQLAAGEVPLLPAKTTAWKSWAERLAAHARSPTQRAELAYWTALPVSGTRPLPLDFEPVPNLAGEAATVSVELSKEVTRDLLRAAPAAYRTRADELLLTALGRALARCTGGERVLLDLEGHGREEVFAGVDLSRTVGWFTTLFPVVLDLAGDGEPGAAIRAVKEQLRAIPSKGLGFGLLRFLGDPGDVGDIGASARLAALPAPEVSFNYLGQLDSAVGEETLLAPAAEAVRGVESPGAPRGHLVEINALVLNERLRLDWTYSTRLHRAATVEALARDAVAELQLLIDHCLSPEAGGYTPSDFPLVHLGPGELDALLGTDREVEDLYPLAPLQQGMLFHSLFAPGSELYFEQLTAILRGRLDLAAFTHAWQRVTDRHPALRTAFLGEGQGAPLQVVHRGVILDWQLLDGQEVRQEDRERRFRALAAADRRRGFDLSRAPLMRLTLVRTGDEEHRLLWSFHHLLFDGWCFSLLFSEVFALYAGLVAGQEPVLPPVRPYRDYLAWLARRDPAEAEGFWRRDLEGFAAPTPLPCDHPAAAPGLAAADYRDQEIVLGEAASTALTGLARRLAVTANVLLQAAWALLLSRFAREADVVFGTVVSGRPADLPGVESIVGLFINTVPVRATVPAGEEGSLAAWLGRLRAAQSEVSRHEWTPLARIQGTSEVPAGRPLFDSLLVFENYPLDPGLAAGVAGLAIADVEVSERTNYALTLTAAARGQEGLTLRLLHDPRFEPITARRLLGHLEALLASFVADPERPPTTLPGLTAAERHQLLVEWSDTGVPDAAEEAPVHESFRAKAAAAPDALAVVAGISSGDHLTYGELDRRSDRLARRLRRLRVIPGVGREAVVGLAVGRSTALPVGLFGILKAGAAWVPLDPALPAERLAFLLADSGARAIVAEERFAAALPAGTLPVLRVEEVEQIWTGEPLPEISPSDLAYVLYTSGTTGRPKGVQIEHGNLARVLAASWRGLGWGSDERVLAVAPFSFDISIWELVKVLALGAGGVCEILPLDPVPDPARLVLALRAATRMHAVPALLRQVAAAVRAIGGSAGTAGIVGRVGDFPLLRGLYMGGDAAPAELRAELLALFPGVDLRVLYGPTEGTILCTSFPFGKGEAGAAPLGRPLPEARLRLVDPAGLPVPIGAAGEIWLGGAGVGRGYLALPERTAQSFVTPADEGGERWYRTGDLARFRPDGNLEFLGRLDDQVKVRGIRVEPGEIEATLAALPAPLAPREAAVLALPSPTRGEGERRLVAFVVGGGEELRAALLARLPEPLVPEVFVPLAALPRTAHGKLDRPALARLAATLEDAPRVSPVPLTPPRGATEEALAAIWRAVLGLERVGVEDDFFHLGGDSILSLQVVTRARQAGLLLTPRQIFEHPTIAGLAPLAERTLPGPAGAEQGPITGDAPLTPLQSWFLRSGGPDLHRFAQALLLDLSGVAAVPARLAPALTRLADHHDALRLRFTRQPDGTWRQSHAAPGEPISLLAIDLAALPAAVRPAALAAASEELPAGFDLARGPLFLGALFTAEDGWARLLLAAHHLVVDTVSWRILLADLGTLWDPLPVPALPAKTTSWQRWAAGLAAAACSSAFDPDREHWFGLAAAFAAALPADGALPPLPAGLAAGVGGPQRVSVALSEDATEALLRRAPGAYRTQVNDLLLTALARALGGFGGRRGPLLVDLEGHGREEEAVPGVDLSRTVGWFTSVFPVALDLSGTPEPGAALRRVKELLRSIPRHGLGYGVLRHLGSAEERHRLAPLDRAEVSFNYLGQLDRPFLGAERFRLAPEPTAGGPGEVAGTPRRHRLEINAMVLGERLRVDWTAAGGEATRPAVERLAERFVAALAELVEHCLSPAAGGYTPSDFPLAGLDTATLDELFGAGPAFQNDVEDLYPLAPLQQGMLFHDLYAPGSGLYLQQLTCTLTGPLDLAAFRQSWQAVLDRHPALRTGFLWQGLARPLQVVRRGVPLPWREEDLRGTPAAELAERLAGFAAAELARGFDPARPPLLAAALARTGGAEHRFVWTFHHLLFDGWCFALLFRDLFAFYRAALGGLEGESLELPPVRPYRDHVAWLERRDSAAAERHWRGALAGFAAPTPLPLDTPKAAPGTSGEREVLLSPAVTAELAAFARASGLTANTLFQGAWGLLLSRYAGERDVVFGTVVAGRPPELPGVETMIGLFINTLPVRLDADPGAPLATYLRALQENQAEMRQDEHAPYAPLAEIQRWSAVPPGEPLFSSLFVFENYPVDDSLGEGAGALQVRDVRLADRADHPLSLAVAPVDAGRRLGLRFTYDGRLAAATVDRLARHLTALLDGFVSRDGGERRLADLPLLTAAERHQLLAEWGAADLPAGLPLADVCCLHQLVEAQAARTPAALAVVQGGREVRYGELDRAAATLALRLRALGVGPEARVPLLAERSPETVVGLLAILKAGGAYVPLDPGAPADRLALLLAKIRSAGSATRLPLLLNGATAAALPEAAREGFVPVLLDDVLTVPPDMPDMPEILPEIPGGARPENLAYVLHTSGSTGTPKGVMVDHRAIVSYLRAAVAAFGLGPGDRGLQTSSLTFDPSLEELFAPLITGGTVVLPEGGMEAAARFLDFVRRLDLTYLSLPTSYWQTLAATLEAEALPAPPRLRLVVIGGERALPERWSAWGRSWDPSWERVRLVNGYGPTEAIVTSTVEVHPGRRAAATDDGEVPIGRPLPGVAVQVRGRDGELAPPGASGELYLGGRLARGYLDQPALTAERFVPDPHGAPGAAPGARLYRTGDLVRFLSDGRLQFLGRADEQVKVRGFRIELGEVEAALAAHPAVLAAAAGTREDAGGTRSLVAWVVPRGGEATKEDDLERFLAGRLPAWMVPSEITLLAALRLTVAGKVDRRALALLAPARRAGEAYTAPRNAMEEELAALWRELLGVERVGVKDDFFALGGHSLLATQLVSRLRRQLGIDLPLAWLFEARTLESLAAELRRLALDREGPAPEIPPSPRRPGGGPYPLSFSQQRLWFIDRLEPGSATFNLADALRFQGRLDPVLLARVLAEIVRRHEVLRTAFPVVDGHPVQQVAPPGPLPLPLADLAGLPAAAREREARRLAEAEAAAPFDLARGPLLRARLLRLGATDHLALFTLHHIVSDGWSLGVLVRELTALYAAGISEQASGEPSPLPELPIQYADFADWQRRHLTGEVLAGHLAYWRERLAGAPDLLPLPTDRPRPAVQSGRGASLRSQLPLDTALAAARPRGETLFMVLLAALAAVLARHSGQEDLLVGTPIANRTHVETEGLIGFFVNTLILRADLGNLAGGEEATFADLLAQVRETTLGAYAHQDLPFERLVEELRPARDLSHAPLSQVTLALQNAPLGTLALPGLTFVPVELPARTTMLDLTLEAAEVAGGLVLDWRYDRDLFDATTICRLAGHFAILLQAAAADPDRTLADLPLLSAAERHQLAGEWSAGDPAPPPLCLHAPAEAQARRDPEALALVQGVERLTYGELDARANRLAHRLAALGVGPEVRVAICIERSVHRLVAALAAQKAGGAYVPLDPTYPAERLGFMLADSGAPVLVISPATREILAAPPGVIRVDVEAESRPGAALGPPTAVTPANTAYVIYTSGSTGQPKGVAVSHGAVTPTALLGARLLGARPGARLLQLASFSFDSSVLDVWGGLGLGATLHLPWPGSLLSGPDLASQLREERISGAVATPSVLATLDAESLPALRFVMAGGERCPAEEMERWSADRRFSNAYGPTEASIFAAVKLLGPRSARGLPPPVLSIIGRPVPGARLHVVDRRGRPVPVGATGELRIGGPGLARGYLGGPEKTAWSFVPDPFSGLPGERLYRTGDLACWLPDGDLTVLGRIDQQVKLRGVRIELGEIAAALAEHPAVAQATVQLRPGPTGPRLVAWVVPRQAGEGAGDAGLAAALRAHLRARLPEAMVPAAFVSLAALPVTPNGKLDPAALPEPGALPGTGHVGPAWIAPRSGLEREIAAVWQEVLQVERVGAEDNFFDLGGHSLLLVEVQARLGTQLGRLGLGREIPLLDLFRHPSPAALARHLQGTEEDERPLLAPRISVPGNSGEREVAVVGMAGRFPGAPDLDRFWENLRAGVESISFFSPEEAAAAGVDAALLADPAYVRAGGVLAGADLFDAGFFDVAPREAQLMDPQQRLFLESATEALENAGYGAGSPAARTVRIGVYAGAGMSEYGIRNLFGHPGIGGGMEVMLGNDKDFVATRASYKLDLRGPALTVQTACSTSLVAVHLACRALLEGECDLALAGGVGIGFPQNAGYLYEEGGVNSPDGHNRAFDARARGTVGGSGLGLVVLKPLAAALADGDTVHAVVRGTAINNDGAGKVGYTAPSESGQAEVIARAQEIAGVAPETIQYVEAHGSATPIGDPIEVAALTRAFRARRGEAAEPESGFCSLGSVKSNIGHTGSAAGIAGLLKTVLALEHREIPPTLHYETPNPRLQLEGSPFRIAAELTPWPARFEEGRPVPRRAGVSSFGLGGTNAHAVLEEAPPSAPSGPARPWHLLALSARTASALEAATDRLVEHLRRNPAMGLEELANMADIAHTLHTGRRGMEHRRILVCRDREDALAALASRDPRRVLQSTVEELAEGAGAGRPVAFVFAGLGEQYPGMARGLYREEPGFREAFDRVAEFFVPYLGVDLKDLLFPAGEEVGGERGALDLRRLVGRAPATPADSPLDRTALLQPAFFALEYALASLLLEWGVKPQAMIGYSLGEYVAACFAGVLSLAAAARLVARRARLVDALPAGAMLAVSLAEAELATLLSGRPENLSIAAVNGDRATVAAGPPEAIAALERRLAEQGIASRRLRTTHAFHSPMLQPAAEPLATAAREIELHPPRLPYLSNVTGTWITASQATDPQYWAEHLLRPVRFAQGIAELWREPGRILLEIGPGPSLSALALQQAQGPDPVALPTLPGAFERRPDRVVLLDALGKLWLAGARVDWPRLYARERRRRLPLPTYPFERQRYWIEPPAGEAVLAPAREIAGLYLPSFRRTPPLPPPAPGELGGRWLLFADSCGVGAVLAERLRAQGAEVAVVAPGDSGRGGITRPTRIVHLWGLGGAADRELGFPSLLALLHALAAGITPEDPDPLADLRALVVGSGLARVTAEDPLYPELAPLTALCRTLPAELPGVVCRVVDAMAPATARQRERLADALLAELLAPPAFSDIADIALRGGERWVRTFEPLPAVAVDGLGAGPLVFLGRPEDGGLALATRLADSAGSAMVHAADEAALRGAVEAGAVAGVVVGEGLGLDLPELPLVTATRERCDAVLGAAAERLSRLAAVLDRHPPGFCLLTAGFTVRIGPGRLLATAVDALVAAFAEQQAEAGLFPWAVLQWDPADPLPPGLLAALTRGTAPRLLAAPEEPLARLARLQNAAAAFAEQPAEAVGAGRPPTGVTLHPRPHLRNPYVPPATDTERALAGMWQALLGLETVGIQDSFFDLGGDSLLGTQVITRVRESFGVDLALPALFELPTPAALAERIDQLRPEGETETEKVARMLETLESLSPEEVERMLAERGVGPEG